MKRLIPALLLMSMLIACGPADVKVFPDHPVLSGSDSILVRAFRASLGVPVEPVDSNDIVTIVLAWDKYLVSGDTEQLSADYAKAKAMMDDREMTRFVPKYGLFRDLDKTEKLSSNCGYAKAYLSLQNMARVEGDLSLANEYFAKAFSLRNHIRDNFYNSETDEIARLIDKKGKIQKGENDGTVALAVATKIFKPAESARVVAILAEKQGPDPMLANAALIAGNKDLFVTVMREIASEILGGNQKLAPGYISLVYSGLFGMSPDEDGMKVFPDPEILVKAGITSLTDFTYRNEVINFYFKQGTKNSGLSLCGKKSDSARIPMTSKKVWKVLIYG